MEIILYTDGSSRGNPGKGGWGAILIAEEKGVGSKEKEWVQELGGRDQMTTNNRMEITALIEGLRFVYSQLLIVNGEKANSGKNAEGAFAKLLTINYKPLTINVHADSEYVLKGISTWMKDWKKRGWKTAAKKSVLNQDLWQVLDDLVLQLQDAYGVKFVWTHVRGHSGHVLNDRADEIATTFADNEPTELYSGLKTKYPYKEKTKA